MSLESFPTTPESEPKPQGWFRRLGSKALAAFENAVENGYLVGPHGGIAHYYIYKAEQELAEQQRLEAEERLIEPGELIDWDDETTFERGRE